MKGTLIGILALIVVSSSLALPSFGYTAAPYSWRWTQCNGATVKGNVEGITTIGTDYVTVSWNVPASSYELSLGCQKQGLTDVSITTNIQATGFIGIPQTKTSSSSSNALVFTYVTETCSLHSCSSPTPYFIKFGDYVTISINACYDYGFYCHGTTYTFQVKS